jgi:hypothetical protein
MPFQKPASATLRRLSLLNPASTTIRTQLAPKEKTQSMAALARSFLTETRAGAMAVVIGTKETKVTG